VLRRIETYSLQPGPDSPVPGAPGAEAPGGDVSGPGAPGPDPPARSVAGRGDGATAFREALGACPRHIPEVLHSAVGRNRSGAPVHLVWEHAFESPEAYRRYMVHPYHATVLDRYILHDSPERVVAGDRLGAGLIGYHCAQPSFRLDGGVRRLVLLRLAADAGPGAVEELGAGLVRVPDDVPGMRVSVMAANTLGSAWFDGVTPITGPPRWTHLWEQGFASEADLAAYRAGPHPVAGVERGGVPAWVRWSGGIVTKASDVWYELERAAP